MKKIDIKIKIAVIAVGLNIVLTVVKFLLYYFSGSMAILAEAWHSFGDIATSLLVSIALIQAAFTGSKSDNESEEKPKKRISYFELTISFFIGILLAIIAGTLLKKCIQAQPQAIENSLASGVIFLVFSIGSYFIYRLETRIGTREDSIGLISDGMHARADMIASLLTGFSLILYYMGLDLDRWVAGLIALFIFAFAVETIVNVALVYFRKESEQLFQYRSFRIISFVFDKTAVKKSVKSFFSVIETKFGNKKVIKVVCRTIFVLPLTIIAVIYLSTVFFTVGIREKAVVERFGRPVNINEPVGSGLHVKWPWPVDRVIKIKATYIEELNIGNISDKKMQALLWSRAHGVEEPFLSGDNNFFYPYIVLHYRVKNVFQYLYKNIDSKILVDEAGHRIATAFFAQKEFYDIAVTQRKKIEHDIFTTLQTCLDELESGIELLSVNFKDIHPPMSVADSFEKVIAAYQEKQETINNALGYQNDVVPESRGMAASELEAAKSYITDRENRAVGKSTRFSLSLPASRHEKDVTMSRIYLQTITDVLQEKTKIVIDPKAGKPDIWMGFENSIPQALDEYYFEQ